MTQKAVYSLPVFVMLSLIGCATTVQPAGRNAVSSPVITQQTIPVDGAEKNIKAQQLFIRGLTQAFLNQHTDAIVLYEQALQYSPNNAAVLSAISEAQEAVGNTTDAFYYAQQACNLDPDNNHYLRLLARMYLSSGDYQQAAETYQKMAERFPDDVSTRYELARVHTLDGRIAEAIKAYEDILDTFGEDLWVRGELLRLYIQTGDEEKAERALVALIERQPENISFRRMLGEIYLRQNRPEEAILLFEEALEINPADFESVLGLADLYHQLGDDEKAGMILEKSFVEDDASAEQLLARAAHLYTRMNDNPVAAETAQQLLMRVLEKEPKHVDALFMLGDIHYLEGRYRQAGDLLHEALQQNPRDPQVWHQAAAAYIQAGMAREAADVAEEGLLLFPGQIPILRLSGFANMEVYRNDIAISRFEEALDILLEDSPDDLQQIGELYSALGLLYSRKRDIAASDEAYRQAIASDPENDLALNNYAYSLAGRNIELADALGLAKRAVSLRQDNASYMDTLGWIHFLLDNLEEAKEWIGKAIATEQASATVYEHYGDVFEKLGQADEARHYWQKALEMNPDNTSLLQKLEQS